MPAEYIGTNLNELVSGLDQLFSTIQSAINTQVLSKELLIFGKSLDNSLLLQDLWKSNVFDGVTLTVDNIAAKLAEATGGVECTNFAYSASPSANTWAVRPQA
jgi:hypothetical protein